MTATQAITITAVHLSARSRSAVESHQKSAAVGRRTRPCPRNSAAMPINAPTTARRKTIQSPFARGTRRMSAMTTTVRRVKGISESKTEEKKTCPGRTARSRPARAPAL